MINTKKVSSLENLSFMRAIGILLLAIIYSCSDDISLANKSLSGQWVELETRTDTLSFSTLYQSDIMTLDRGQETLNGTLKPKHRSGAYEYELQAAEISLRWILSSNSQFETYSFTLENELLYIGNFYNSTSGPILVFERIE